MTSQRMPARRVRGSDVYSIAGIAGLVVAFAVVMAIVLSRRDRQAPAPTDDVVNAPAATHPTPPGSGTPPTHPTPKPPESDVAVVKQVPGKHFHLATISPDGKSFFLASGRLAVRCEAATGAVTGEYLGRGGDLFRYVTVSPDGHRLAAVTTAGVIVFDAKSSEQLAKIDALGMKGAVFSQDSNKLFVIDGRRKEFGIWNPATGVRAGSIPFDESVTDLTATPDGRWALAITTSGDRVTMVDLEAGRVDRTFDFGPGSANCVAISADGRWAVSGSSNSLRAWDLATGQRIWEAPATGYTVVSVAISQDGRRILAGCRRTNASRPGATDERYFAGAWSAAGAEVCRTPWLTAEPEAVALARDGRTAVVVEKSEQVRVWRLPSAAGSPTAPVTAAPPPTAWPGPGNSLTMPWDPGAIAVSPDSRLAIVGDRDRLTLYQLPSGRVSAKWVRSGKRSTYGYSSLCFSADGKRAVSCEGDGVIRVWDVATGREIRSWGLIEKVANSNVMFRPDSTIVLTARNNTSRSKAQVWNPETGEKIAEWAAPPSLALSPKGDFMAFGSPEGGVGLRTLDGSRRWELRGAGFSDSTSVKISPDGRTILTGGSVARVWDVASGAKLGEFLGEKHQTPIGFTPDSRRVFTTSTDNTLRVWDLSTGKEEGYLKVKWTHDHHGLITPDGRAAILQGRNFLNEKTMMWGLPDYKPAPLATTAPTLKLTFPAGGAVRAEVKAGLPPPRVGERTKAVLLLTTADGPAVDDDAVSALIHNPADTV